MTSPIIRFYLDDQSLRNEEGMPDFTIKDFLYNTFEWLEGCHNHIQWVFPLTEPSQFNKNAPILNDDDIRLFKHCDILIERVQRATRRYAWFLMVNHHIWVRPYDHNHLRITRIIKFLKMIGRFEDAKMLYDYVTYEDENKVINPETYQYWHDALNA